MIVRIWIPYSMLKVSTYWVGCCTFLIHHSSHLTQEYSIWGALLLLAQSGTTIGLLRKTYYPSPLLCSGCNSCYRNIASLYFIFPLRLPLLFILTCQESWFYMGWDISPNICEFQNLDITQKQVIFSSANGDNTGTSKGDCEDKCKNVWNLIIQWATWKCTEMEKKWHRSHYFFLHPYVGTQSCHSYSGTQIQPSNPFNTLTRLGNHCWSIRIGTW